MPGAVQQKSQAEGDNMRIYPHLSFNGQCEEAFREYHRILGGTIETMMKYGDSPMVETVDSQWHDRIIHASLQVGQFELAGTDLFPHDYKEPQGYSVILSLSDTDQARQIFDQLSKSGEIHLPFQKTFWSTGFGVLRDRFRIPWEINCEEPPKST